MLGIQNCLSILAKVVSVEDGRMEVQEFGGQMFFDEYLKVTEQQSHKELLTLIMQQLVNSP